MQYFYAHPKAKKAPIKGPQHPSLNWYCRAGNVEVNNTKQAWKGFMLFILEKNKLLNKRIEKCAMIYRTFFKDKRTHDDDNVTPKFILDGLTEGGFLVADDYQHLNPLTTFCGYDKLNPRIELVFIFDE